MAETPRVGELEIDQDLAFERREWAVQRAWWWVMLLVAAGAVLGFLGPGPLTRLTAGREGSELWVEYDRFGRYEAPSDILVHFGPEAVRDGRARIWVDREFLEGVALEAVTPDAERVEAGQGRLTYVFPVSGLSAPTAVRLRFRPQAYWGHRGKVGIEGGPEVGFSQFVYP